MKAIETVIFNGVKYRRYANAPYFKPGAADRAKGAVDLHKEIWRAANSEIPPGHDIHHRDGNPLNNDLSNLQLMTSKDHQALHVAHRRAIGWYTTPERLAILERARPLAAAWHSTEDGHTLHSRNGRKVWDAVEERTKQCEQCEKEFDYRCLQTPRFCSNKCKAAFRRASGIDDEGRTCAYCHTAFRVSRYSKARTCSMVCGQRLRRGHDQRP